MSREERRAYKRMTKNQDPYAVPLSAAQRARMEKQRARQARRPAGREFRFVTNRFLVVAAAGAALVGLIAFSIAWPNGMPTAGYVGLAAAAVWAVLSVGMRLLQRRASRIQR